MKKAAFLFSDVCTEERLEARKSEEIVKDLGMELTPTVKDADLIVIYTCAVFKEREDKTVALIEDVQRKKRPGQKVVVCGCLPKINKKRLDEVFDGASFGPRDFDKLKEHLSFEKKEQGLDYNTLDQNDRWFFYHRRLLNAFLMTKAFIKQYLRIDALDSFQMPQLITNDDAYYILTGVGCMRECTFCAIRFAKGRTQSKPMEEVVREFKRGLEKGYKKITLCNDDLGYYGNDFGADLPDLLNELIKIDGNFEINLREINPDSCYQMLPKLEKVIASGRIKTVTVSIQSGSNRILELMKRGSTAEEFKEIVVRLRKAYPKLAFRSALMVGFPTETDEDFKATLQLLDEVKLDMIDVYSYSNRPNTLASRMESQVDGKIIQKRARSLKLKALQNVLFGMAQR